MKEESKLLIAIGVTAGLLYYVMHKNTKAPVVTTSTMPITMPPATPPPGELLQMDAPKMNFTRQDNFANMASTPVQDGSGGFFSSQKVKLNY